MTILESIQNTDKELAMFLAEELKDSNIPEYFDDPTYMPTSADLQTFTEEQLEYLKMSANEDESDVYCNDDPTEYTQMHDRKYTIDNMIREELNRRNAL